MKAEKVINPICPSFIGWLGGKTKLRGTIINSFPVHNCYVEVFAGSAVVFFGKPEWMTRKIEIVNDINGELVNLMKVLSGTYFDEKVRQEFISYVRNMPASRSAFQEWQKLTDKQLDKLTPAQRAFRFYYCTKKGFSSVLSGGYEASPYSGSRYNQNTDFEVFTERFRKTNAQIESLDFEVLIDKYNKDNKGVSDTFYFADPPYWVANNTNYYEFVFNKEDHLRFKKACDRVAKTGNRFLITYDDVQEIHDLYSDYYIYRTDKIVYQAANEQKERELAKTEIFITNYDIAEVINKRSNDLFESEVIADDNRIEIPGNIGLTKVNK